MSFSPVFFLVFFSFGETKTICNPTLLLKLHNQNRKRESGHVIVMEFPVRTTTNSVTQGKQHNAVFVTQTIPLARIVL